MRLPILFVIASLAVTPAQPLRADTAKKPNWILTGSLRVREELWDWFGTGTGQGRYAFTGEVLRLGAMHTAADHDLMLELQQTGLFDLPNNSTLSAPKGQLGLGAAYYAASGNRLTGAALKQAFVKIKDPKGSGSFLRGGRFEFVDGTETVPSDPSLAYLKRDRIAHRLIGNFAWSHVGRSVDGAQFSNTNRATNVTLFGGVPTTGAFDQSANDEIEGVNVAYGSISSGSRSKQSPYDARLFGAHYEDGRRNVVKVDNRPAAARAGDTAGIRLETVGAHYLRRLGPADVLLWGAYQTGSWGSQSHEAFAYATEAGWQLTKAPWKPWLRIGWYVASGDGNSADGKHSTFFPMLPTPRIYARFPFYSETNLKDAFVQLIVRPTTTLTARLDFHRLALDSPADLWYTGGGAFQQSTFGYTGRPSGGFGSLADLIDLSVDWQPRPNTMLSLYVGYARGGNVIKSINPGQNGAFAYVEVTRKW